MPANNRLATFLMIIVALSPIPLGSNRPIFWAISAMLVGVAALVYAISLLSKSAQLRFPLKRLPATAMLFFIFILYLTMQILPVGEIGFESHSGLVLTASTLSIAPGETTLMLLRQLGYGLFFFLMLQVGTNSERAKHMLRAVFVITIAEALYALFTLTQLGDTGLFFDKTAYLGVATGTFINRNALATFLAIGTIAGMTLLLTEKMAPTTRGEQASNRSIGAWVHKAAYIIALFVCISALLATQSRMGLISFAIGMIVVLSLCAVKARKGTTRAVGLALAGTIAVTTIASALFGFGLVERLGSADNDFDIRMELYSQIIEMAQTRPLLGFGGGSFEYAYPLFHHLPVSPDLIWDKAHSTYLALWTELGFVFGSIPLIIFGLWGLLLWRMATGAPKQRPMAIAALGALVAVALHAALDFSLEIQANTYLLLAVLALGIAGQGKPMPNKDD